MIRVQAQQLSIHRKALSRAVIATFFILAALMAAAQTIVLKDGFESTPVLISSLPVTNASVDSLYFYDVEATGPLGETLTFSLTDSPAGMSIDPETGEISWTPSVTGDFAVSVRVEASQGGSADQAWSIAVSPPVPVIAPSAIDPSVFTRFSDAITFLYEGEDAIQFDVQPNALRDYRVGVIRGTVLSRDGVPLVGARVNALRQGEIGYTLTRADGEFDLAVNGGGTVVIEVSYAGYLTAQRSVDLPWNDYRSLDPIRLVALSNKVTQVSLSPTGPAVARGEVSSDDNGTRQGTLFFRPGTSAEMELEDGSRTSLSDLGVRVTEFTVGPNGPEAMPAQLPPTSGYTYAAEFTVDEALQAGAVTVHFDPAVVFYVENFVGFPVGSRVPLGVYQRREGSWEAAPDGLVIEIVSESGGLANVDLDGDGVADDPTTIDMSDAERQQLAALYEPGQVLWRVEIAHFSPWDCNWPFGPPSDARGPRPEHGPDGNPLPDEDCEDGIFSRVACQSQLLRDDIPIVGTGESLHYRSDRSDRYQARRALDLFIPEEEIPDVASSVRFDLQVAGVRLQENFLDPTLDVSTRLVWDGTDAYGRNVYGSQPYELTISFVYDGIYASTNSGDGGGGGGGGGSRRSVESFFDQPGGLAEGNMALGQVLLQRKFRGELEGLQPPLSTLGDWTLTNQHRYAPAGELHLGNGDIRRDADGVDDRKIRRLDSTRNFRTWEKSAEPLPDGSVLIGQQENGQPGQIYRVDRDGTTELVAGSLFSTASAEDGPNAKFRKIGIPNLLETLDDGTIIFAETARIRSIDPDDFLRTITGVGALPIEENPDYVGPAEELDFTTISDMAIGPAGSIFVAAAAEPPLSDSIWKITPEGTAKRVAGTILDTGWSEGQSALEAEIVVDHLAVAANGDIYFSHGGGHQVWRISEGVVERAIGSGQCTGNYAAEGPALTTELCLPGPLTIDAEGFLYVTASGECTSTCDLGESAFRIFVFNGERFDLIAGGPVRTRFPSDGDLALGTRIGNRADELKITPEGNLLIKTGTGREDSWFIEPLWADQNLGELLIPDETGRLLFAIGLSGRHERTIDTFLNRVIRTFGYDADGLLTTVADVYGRETVIERGAGGLAQAIVGPDGRRTVLGHSNGQLVSLANPGNETYEFSYGAERGPLVSTTDPRGNSSSYSYDADGRLVAAVSKAGGTITLVREALGVNEFEVTATRRGTEQTVYRTESDGTTRINTVIDPTGATTVVRRSADGIVQGTFPDGTTAVYRSSPDPRFGARAMRVSEVAVTTPDGLSSVATIDVSTQPSVLSDFTQLEVWTETLTRDGKSSATVFNLSQRTLTSESAEGRVSTLTFDEFGELVQESPGPGFDSTDYSYDAAAGRLTGVTRGTDSITLAYDGDGDLVSATDDDGGVTSYGHDVNGRVTSLTLPGGATYGFTYDANGNRTAITMPDGEVHAMAFDANNRLEAYTRPGASPLQLNFDGLGRRLGVTYPDGTLREDLFTNAQLSGSDLPRATLTLERAPEVTPGTGVSQQVSRLVREPVAGQPQATDLTLDGRVVKSVAMSGPASATVTYTHAVTYQPSSWVLNNESPIALTYDDDDLLTGLGPFLFTRSVGTGLLEGVSDDILDLTLAFDSRAQLAQKALVLNPELTGSTFHELAVLRDERARIVEKVETVATIGMTTRRFAYDDDGQLIAVTDGSDNPVESFTYDDKGNRTSATDSNGTVNASFDERDELTNRGGVTYGYDDNGFLATRGADQFDYTVDGILRSATVGGAQVGYTYDYYGRRVTRTDAGGTTTFVYGNPGSAFQVTASIAPGGGVSQYFYDDANYLFAMLREGTWYYVGTDQAGSPRVVVRADTEDVMKAVSYSAFGEVLSDSNPGFVLPVGFAGGLADPVSDLIRIGWRDYEPASGRFTAPDPLLQAGLSPNLFLYAGNDPVNYGDLMGMVKISLSGYAILGGGLSLTITENGLASCAEAGVGVGGGIGFEPFAGLPQAGTSLVAAGGIGPAGLGFEYPFDECWSRGEGRVRWDGDSYSPVSKDTFQKTVTVTDQEVTQQNLKTLRSKTQKLGRTKIKLGAEGSLTGRYCLPPVTW